MKGKTPYLLTYLLLGGILGLLAFTASDYVDCKDLGPDEFLDLALESHQFISPVLNPRLNTQPSFFCSLRTQQFQKADLLTNLLRC
jgi:hypothetical protein